MIKFIGDIVPVYDEECGIHTEIICPISTDFNKCYHHLFEDVDKIYVKGEKIMVDVEKIKLEVENLKSLTAEEYCREEVEKIYADFEASRDAKIKDLETALAIFDKYQVVEEVAEVEEVVAENNEEIIGE